MKETLIKELNRFRDDQSLWQELAWKKSEDGKDYHDDNALKRTRVLYALQWDLQSSDEDLLRFLMEEEIKDRNADPFQGSSESLVAGGYLLASFKNPANVWLFVQAKSANFDTHCGFDYKHLLSAGVQATFDYIAQNKDPEHKAQASRYQEYFDDYFPDLATCSLSEDDIVSWHQYKQDDYLKVPSDEDTKYWLEVALEIDELPTAQKLVVQLETQSDESLDSLSDLKFYKEQVGDYAGATVIAQKIFEQRENAAWKDYVALIQSHLNNDDPASAWQMIAQALETCDSLSDYEQKRTHELALDVVLASDGHQPFALEAYRLSMNNIDRNLALVDLEKHLEATRLMGDKASELIVKQRYDAENDRINASRSRLKNNKGS